MISNDVSGPDGSTEDSRDRDVAYRESIARLYREHNQALLKFLRLRVYSDQEALEVAQEAYVRMLQLESMSAVSFLSSYLFMTAANIAINRGRRKSLAYRANQEIAECQTAHTRWKPNAVFRSTGLAIAAAAGLAAIAITWLSVSQSAASVRRSSFDVGSITSAAP